MTAPRPMIPEPLWLRRRFRLALGLLVLSVVSAFASTVLAWTSPGISWWAVACAGVVLLCVGGLELLERGMAPRIERERRELLDEIAVLEDEINRRLKEREP